MAEDALINPHYHLPRFILTSASWPPLFQPFLTLRSTDALDYGSYPSPLQGDLRHRMIARTDQAGTHRTYGCGLWLQLLQKMTQGS